MALFWLNDPMVLFNTTKLWPTATMDMTDQLNALTRLTIVATVLGYFFTQNYNFLFIGVLTIVLIAVFHLRQKTQPTAEGFGNHIEKLAEKYTVPTKKNPFMNVLLPEINGDPNRNQALPPTTETDRLIKASAQKGLDPRLLKGINDEMNFDASLHQFYTTPSTTVGDDGFKQFCYGDIMQTKTAKEGDEHAMGKYKGRIGGVYV